jgi:hypothetical protein
MGTIAYHGTTKLESILVQNAVFSPFNLMGRGYPLEDLRATQDTSLQEYRSMTSKLALLAKQKQLPNRGDSSNEEELADIAATNSIVEGSSEYRELKRNYFVWFGPYDAALRHISNEGYVLEAELSTGVSPVA